MKTTCIIKLALSIMLSSFVTPVWAHTGIGGTYNSFMAGFAHPWQGVDHLLVIFATGLWGCVQGGKQVWALPLSFLLLMATGASLGFADIALPYAELWVSLSVLVFGLIIGLDWQASTAWAMGLVAIVALFHGYVHAAEIARGSNQIGYALGFLLTTAILHGLGIASGLFGAKAFSLMRISLGLIGAAVGVLLLAS